MQASADYHAHFYFAGNEAEQAGALCNAMRAALGLSMGRIHRQPVGPHPRGSCQMTIPAARIGEAIEWLMLHRGRFTVFCHGNSGDDLADHTAHVMWLGPSENLDLSQFGLIQSKM